MPRLNYLEFPTRDIKATRTFYESVFGWQITQFAPTYAATTSGDTEVGRAGVHRGAAAGNDLEATLVAVQEAGATVVRPI